MEHYQVLLPVEITAKLSMWAAMRQDTRMMRSHRYHCTSPIVKLSERILRDTT